MENINDFIERFWAGQTTREEEQAFLNRFHQQEGDWKSLLQDEFTQEEASPAQNTLLSGQRSADILEKLHGKIAPAPVEVAPVMPMRRHWIKYAAAAAVIVLVIGVALFRRDNGARVVTTPVVRAERLLVKRHNPTGAVEEMKLPDGSLARLSPGSTICYTDSFDADKRDIQLSGEAWFSVAKDAVRPFSVAAGAFKITALGTRFLMSDRSPHGVRVRLFEGRVVVRSGSMQDVYLSQGQQFEWASLNGYAVQTFRDSATMVNASSASNPSTHTLQSKTSSVLEFKQEPLAGVLHKLSRQYRVSFRLDGKGFDNMLITGKFLPSDSLSTVLSMLGSINGLSFHENGKTIVVSAAQ